MYFDNRKVCGEFDIIVDVIWMLNVIYVFNFDIFLKIFYL